MFNKLKPKSEFSRNVLTLMTGTTIAQAIPIAISPILTRIYTPEDFGMFALYMSIASILSVVATGRYELAIMLPKKDEDAVNIVALSIIISFFVSFIALLLVYFFNPQITSLLGNPEISSWLYFIPVTVLLTGVYQSFNYWNNRKKQYKRLAMSKVLQSGTTATSNLGMGFSGFGSSGLILSGVLGQGVATAFLGRIVLGEYKERASDVKKLKMFALTKKYKNFPKINMPHAFLNIFSSELPILLISYFFNTTVTGFYALSNRVLVAPMSIIINSFGQVFLENMNHLYKTQRDKELIFFKSTTIKLLTYSFPIFFIFYIFSKDIFSIVFGNDWEIAGTYAQILIPMLYLRFTGSIVSVVSIIHNRQKKALVIEIINTSLRVIALLIAGFMNDIIVGLVLFSAFSFFVTLYRLFWYHTLIKENISEI